MTIVKICGITNLKDAEVAVGAGADYLGFIFYKKSARYVEPGKVGEIVEKIKNRNWREESGSATRPHSPLSSLPQFVGVFVNTPLSAIKATLRDANLDFAQLHGDEPVGVMEALGAKAYKALRPADGVQAEAEATTWFNPRSAGPALMMDAYDPNAYGGTGHNADWHVAAGLAAHYPRFLLAGGLTADNVASAVAQVQPWGVDVAGGVEAEPGKKDHDLVQKFIKQAKSDSEEIR